MLETPNSDPHKAEILERLVTSARELAPEIAAAVPSYKKARDVPAELVAKMLEAGLHKAYIPTRYGGYELDWGAHYYISREIGKACGSAAWIAGLVFTHVMCVARFPEAAQESFFASAKRGGVLATASAGAGTLVKVDGGMTLDGRWGWASGVNHADGLMVIAKEGDVPIFTHFVLLLEGEYEIENNWDAASLHASGSHHVNVTAQFIPAERLVERDVYLGLNPPGSEIHDSYVYRMRPAPLQKSYFAGPLMGTALGALEETKRITRERVGRIFGEKIATQTPVQVNIGVATAETDSAQLIFDEYIRRIHAWGQPDSTISNDDVILWGKRMMTFASRLCLQAADRLSLGLGAGGQMNDQVAQYLFNDCRGVVTHVELNWDLSMASTGMKALGIPTGDSLVDGHEVSAEQENMLGTKI